MEQPRVFHVANEFGIDILTVLAVLRTLGVGTKQPEDKLSEIEARKVRAALSERFTNRGTARQVHSSPKSRTIEPAAPQAQERAQSKLGPTKNWRDVQREALESTIPTMYATLRAAVKRPEKPGIVVLFHNRSMATPYGVCTLEGASHPLLNNEMSALRVIVAPMQEAHRWYRTHHKEAPNVYVAFDLVKGHVWHGRSLSVVQNMKQGPHLNAETLERVLLPTVPTTGEPPRLASRAQRFTPESVPSLRAKVSDSTDRPEEAFLLHEDLLRLAVDSLDGAGVLNPLPVHVNGLWIFARPIIMQRTDGNDRHVRAVWFRQGEMMWRIRTYTAGSSMNVKQVGDQLAGRKPFVAVWDDTRPEQKLLAAIWALMSQGDVTETEPSPHHGNPVDTEHPSAGPLTIVRLKAGTDHAHVYGPDDAHGVSPRASWSVRGHWRHQQYPSLGRDEHGKTRTRPIWISSYLKGESSQSPPAEKVIVVRP